MIEIWKDIRGFEGLYQISNSGNVKSLDREMTMKTGQKYIVKNKILKCCIDGKGYCFVRLSNKGKTTIKKNHRLVAEAFITNNYSKEQVNHKNGNKLDNTLENLEWCTGQENVDHAYKNNLCKTGERNVNHKLSNNDVLNIRKLYAKGHEEFGAKPLARKYNVSSTTIKNIIRGKKWRHDSND